MAGRQIGMSVLGWPARIVVASLLVLTSATAGCAHAERTQLPSAVPNEQLVLRVRSGLYQQEQARTELKPPDVIVFNSGLAVARMAGPDETFQSISLTETELRDVRNAILSAGVTPHRLQVPADRASDDSGATILRVQHASGEEAEVVYPGLLSSIPGQARDLGVPASILAIDELLNRLVERIANEGQPWHGELPMVPTAPRLGG